MFGSADYQLRYWVKAIKFPFNGLLIDIDPQLHLEGVEGGSGSFSIGQQPPPKVRLQCTRAYIYKWKIGESQRWRERGVEMG
jgi:hypothetical protein